MLNTIIALKLSICLFILKSIQMLIFCRELKNVVLKFKSAIFKKINIYREYLKISMT